MNKKRSCSNSLLIFFFKCEQSKSLPRRWITIQIDLLRFRMYANQFRSIKTNRSKTLKCLFTGGKKLQGWQLDETSRYKMKRLKSSIERDHESLFTFLLGNKKKNKTFSFVLISPPFFFKFMCEKFRKLYFHFCTDKSNTTPFTNRSIFHMSREVRSLFHYFRTKGNE